jgi:hypothetical protein
MEAYVYMFRVPGKYFIDELLVCLSTGRTREFPRERREERRRREYCRLNCVFLDLLFD